MGPLNRVAWPRPKCNSNLARNALGDLAQLDLLATLILTPGPFTPLAWMEATWFGGNFQCEINPRVCQFPTPGPPLMTARYPSPFPHLWPLSPPMKQRGQGNARLSGPCHSHHCHNSQPGYATAHFGKWHPGRDLAPWSLGPMEFEAHSVPPRSNGPGLAWWGRAQDFRSRSTGSPCKTEAIQFKSTNRWTTVVTFMAISGPWHPMPPLKS